MNYPYNMVYLTCTLYSRFLARSDDGSAAGIGPLGHGHHQYDGQQFDHIVAHQRIAFGQRHKEEIGRSSIQQLESISTISELGQAILNMGITDDGTNGRRWWCDGRHISYYYYNPVKIHSLMFDSNQRSFVQLQILLAPFLPSLPQPFHRLIVVPSSPDWEKI